jgi:hypothetical protein
MPAQIQLRYPADVGDPDGNLGLRWENTTNTPIVSATDLENGQAVADIYTLAFTKSGVTVTVDVTPAEGSKNTYGAIGVTVTADGATENLNIVPGVSIVLSASIVTGWAGKVSVGARMTSAGATTDILNVGVVEAGSTNTPQRIAAVNVGADDSVQTTVDAVPGMYWSQAGAGDVVAEITNHSDDTREHLGVKGTYALTWANWQDGVGDYVGYKTADLYVDGNLAATTVPFDGTSRIQYGHAAYDDGNDRLTGLSIVHANSTDDPTGVTVTLVVGDGDDYVELAEDIAGSPGAYQTTPLTLTESGETAGTVTASSAAFFWFRWVLPDDATPDAIRLFRLSVRGLTV